ncbi:MAG: crotonase/enoyl-CoA hydratase family protein [Acidimicrobiales bacterium]|nr:crotonase/enoyl-CoA hydratase family protein [Acidimicrobiales bacterium]
MSHPSISTRRVDKVVCISVDDGRANAFSPSLLVALSQELAEAEADAEVGAAVIAGNQKAFFAGFDLDVIGSGDSKAIAEMTTAGGAFIRQAYGASLPVVAASTGHAVAAGALLLCGCDYRVGVDGPVKIGLNEVAIALTLPKWALLIASERLSKRYLQVSVANAQIFDGSGAVDAGFLDEVTTPDEVVTRAIEVAQGFAEQLDAKAYAATVRNLRGGLLGEMDAAVASDRAAAGL